MYNIKFEIKIKKFSLLFDNSCVYKNISAFPTFI